MFYTSKDVIYMITCKKCKMQFIGQTHQLVSNRMNSHKFDIRNMSDPIFSTAVANHFNSNGHSIEDFSCMPIDYVSDNMNILLKETFWIHKLDTKYPKGLNVKVLYSFIGTTCILFFLHFTCINYRTYFLWKL